MKASHEPRQREPAPRRAAPARAERNRRAPFDNPFDVTWRERVVVMGAVFGALAALVTLGLIFAREHTLELMWKVPTSFFVVGKFLPLLALRPDSGFDPYELGIVIGIMDTCTVLVIVYSLEALYRFRPVGRFLEKANRNAQLVLRAYPRMRKFAITAIVLFVLFPVAGTGAIGGSFLGALLGMHRVRLICAVSAGGFIGGLTMAFLAIRSGEAIENLKHSPVVIGLLVALVVGFVWAMNRAYRKALAKAREEEPREP